MADTSLGDDGTEQFLLKNLDGSGEIEPSDNVFDEEVDDDEDPEALAELDKRKEEILEEFLELAIQRRYEA